MNFIIKKILKRLLPGNRTFKWFYMGMLLREMVTYMCVQLTVMNQIFLLLTLPNLKILLALTKVIPVASLMRTKVYQINYRRLVYETMTAVYDIENDEEKVREIREKLIGPVRASMQRVFDSLLLKSITKPDTSGSFQFDKGTAKSYYYKNLSGGEKSAFDLILDLHIKKKHFSDAIYCIDEIDSHIHTRLQGKLLKELVRIVPGNSQLWVTTHSLGVLRAAQDMEKDSPGSVCIINFDGIDLDSPVEMFPSVLGKVTWEKMLSIALDDLSDRVAQKTVIVCEGSFEGKSRKDFDASVYNKILGTHNPDIVFVSGGSSTELKDTRNITRNILRAMLPNTEVIALCDRDDRSDAEVKEWKTDGDIVLPERNLESLLLAEDVIEALVKRENKSELLDTALRIRSEALINSNNKGKPSDNLKFAAGEIYNGLKKLLDLKYPGNNSDAFMRDTLAPLIVPGMATYKELESAIFEEDRKKVWRRGLRRLNNRTNFVFW